MQTIQHPVFRDPNFLNSFASQLKHRQLLGDVLKASDPHFNMPLLYWSAWTDAEALTQWVLSEYEHVFQHWADGPVVLKTFLVCALFGEKVS
jgi:hypothetical protein